MFRSLDPAELSEHINVPFSVWPLPRPQLVWLNERWLIESGLNPLDSEMKAEFASRMLADFAVHASGARPSTGGPRASSLFADRYGGTDGAIHGGSGRCGSKAGFLAKGIGKTPLVCETADPMHKDGLMSLAEAFKEALSSEVIHRELPWGSVPIVAIIDAGFSFSSPVDGASRRAAIVVRPVFVRPAHFERSIFFGRAGRPESEQFQDALRVKTAIQGCVARPEPHLKLTEMFQRFAQQVGASRASRLWQGRFLTSNLSIDGALVDFGSFRSMPNWRRLVGLAGERFGAEMGQLRHAFLSVASYFAKYAPESVRELNPRDYIQQLFRIEQDCFLQTCLRGLGVDSHDDPALGRELSELITTYHHLQRSVTIGFEEDTSSWIYEALLTGHDAPFAAPAAERQVVGRIAELITAADRSTLNVGVSIRRARQFFKPRRSLQYHVVERKTKFVESLVGRKDGRALQSVAAHFLDRQIAKCVSWAQIVPRGFDVLAVASNTYSAVILCELKSSKSRTFWVRATRQGDYVFILGQRVALGDLSCSLVSDRRNAVDFAVPVSQCVNGSLRIGQHDFAFERRSLSFVDELP